MPAELDRELPLKRMRRQRAPGQAEALLERMIDARVMNGFTTVEAAERLGCGNEQISEIEAGSRKIPNDWQFLLKMSQVYSVSVDYLMGISPHYERDVIAAERFTIMRGFEQLQQLQAATMTTAFVMYAAQGKPSSLELESLCDSIEALKNAVQTMRDLSPEFDDMRGGASVLATVERIGDAIAPLKIAVRRMKVEDQNFIDLASGKQNPISYLMDDNNDAYLEA